MLLVVTLYPYNQRWIGKMTRAQESKTFEREMAADEVVFIVNNEGKTCEIVGGKNQTMEDGYTYLIDLSNNAVLQVGEEGFVDGTYDAHASLDDINAILAERPSAPKFR